MPVRLAQRKHTPRARGFRASAFTPPVDLGVQRPERAAIEHLTVPAGFVILLGALLASRVIPEQLIADWFGLQPFQLNANWTPSLTLFGLGVLATAVGASYRPVGGLLGFGLLPMPALAAALGSPIAGVGAASGALLSAWLLRRLGKRDPQAPRDRRGRGRLLADAAAVGMASLVAATVFLSTAGTTPIAGVLLSTASWLGVGWGLDRWRHRARMSEAAGQARRSSSASAAKSGRVRRRMGLLWDSLGWILGTSLAILSTQVEPAALTPALLGYGVLLLIGASRELDRSQHLRRIRDLQSLGSMAQRLIPRQQTSELAQQCLDEVRRTIEFSHFQLRFESGGPVQVFSSLARGPLLEGPAEVPPHPSPAPGIHQRRDWLVLERDLLSRPQEPTEESTSGSEPPRRLAHLQLWLDPRRLSGEEEDLLNDLVPQIAALVDHSRLDREARLDPLTGLARRQVFDRELEHRFNNARADGHAVALALFDLDHFKRINDSFGHDAGDRVLQSISSILSRASEPGGLACRWGGEELALLLWGGADNAARFADQIRGFIEAQEIEIGDTHGTVVRVTSSVGIAAFPDLLVEDASELVRFADEALYAAKESGRNRVLVAAGRGQFREPDGAFVGDSARLDPESIPQL